ncbi:GNAT family N-acetyltransferase [Nocardioides campestrisoli]|uniref:GNAT family N-acetyltransferase n=1 Tax=Nocardioides campestrisoli TaxID=2736757 RepID=UPI00163D54B5|nr:GNAT family N-acetyltransferase [Nocardioides campestrisoli]
MEPPALAHLPPGLTGHALTTRPLRHDDAHAVYELMATQEQADLGWVEIEEADIVSDWARSSADLAHRTTGVFDGEQLVGYVEVSPGGRGDAAVLPELRGRGLGTALAARMVEIAREHGHRVVGMPVPQGSAGDRLLASLGWQVRWTSWVLELPEGAEIPARELPAGYSLAVATPAQLREVWTVAEDAFLEWSERDREPYDDFEASVLGRPGFEPWHLRVVLGPDGAVVGTSLLTLGDEAVYVSRLAVARAHRHQGLAQVLLVDSFAAGRAHGATRCELSTDSRTGALGLYEKVGMQVRDTWVNRAIEVPTAS